MASLRQWLARWRLRRATAPRSLRPAAPPAATSPSSWTATAAGRRAGACPWPPGTGPAPRRCAACSSTRSTSASRRSRSTRSARENWNRPKDEVEALMELFVEMIDSQVPDMHERGARVRFVGRREGAPRRAGAPHRGGRGADRRQHQDDAVHRLQLRRAARAAGRRRGPGGRVRRRAELGRDAVERAHGAEAAPAFTDDDLRRHLYAPEMHDPELLIRTSGELRISNFLLWQCAYAELYFSDRYWPDFGPDDLDAALADYAGRQRRFGGRRAAAPGARPQATPRDDAHHHRRRPRPCSPSSWSSTAASSSSCSWPPWRLLGLNEFYRLTRRYRPLPLAGFLRRGADGQHGLVLQPRRGVRRRLRRRARSPRCSACSPAPSRA